jgi:hypothetical protein
VEDSPKIEWQALEYEERERTRDWFWALGIVIVTASLASIILSNYFFAALIIIGGALLWFFASQKPQTISYELNERGLKAKNHLYLYENIKSFWVEIEKKPVLFIKSERVFMPMISVPIARENADRIRSVMLAQDITEEPMQEHISDKIMDQLGF